MDWMLLPLKRYAEFSGRSRPREYWMYVLFLFLCMTGLTIVERMFGLGISHEWAYRNGWNLGAGASHQGGPLIGLFALGTFIPSLAVAVRRLHDSNRSGWWLLLAFFPVIGTLWLFILMIIGGTRGPNCFGPDPVEPPPL
ncbi:MAG: DUF805 domain-containing protein [Sphingomonadales bacterium]|nr:MAG: DUF805 domain-containing protein [Sphingomonadales bacterium]TNF02803.1 MAG: DUF805 domain-containing protein [Sphingomonadales bacterium]